MESLDGTATCASAPLNVKKQETKTSSAPLTDGRMERKADFNCRNTQIDTYAKIKATSKRVLLSLQPEYPRRTV